VEFATRWRIFRNFEAPFFFANIFVFFVDISLPNEAIVAVNQRCKDVGTD
jgi:hypothetical protein